MNESWTKNRWRQYPLSQKPPWPDNSVLEHVVGKLSQLPALVFAGETRALKQQLADVCEGNAFILQCGDCSEEFSRCNGPRIHNLVKVILQMSTIIAYAGEKRVVKIGRLAGQYAKPRSSATELIGNQEILSYRGDMINSPEPNITARIPDPSRMIEAYFRSTATLNLVRAFTHGGYATMEHAHAWHRDFGEIFPPNSQYEDMVKGIKKAIKFMSSMGLDLNTPQLNQATVYTSHEALLLDYEEAMTRIDTTTGEWYDTSAHMLWVGDRTRHADGAHVEFLRGIGNPVGVKIGPQHDIDEIKKLIGVLNPRNQPGRLTLITRFGSSEIGKYLPRLLREISYEGFKINWCCDPMHGNTFRSNNNVKTRRFEDIVEETRMFWQIQKAEGTVPGGVHLELTGDNVTECIGGRRQLRENDLSVNYESNCDPRLNAEQAVEYAFEMSSILNPQY